MKIVTLGSGASGSSAIEDYLFGRQDVYNPELNQEFRLIQDPGGLVDLHAAICFGFHMNRASAAIKSFLELCERFGNPKSGFPQGLNYAATFSNYDGKVRQFVENITAVTHTGIPFCERSKFSKRELRRYERKWVKAKQKGDKYEAGVMYLPVTEDVFLREAEKFLDSLFIDGQDIPESQPVVIEQGGSFWAPVSTTQYFGKRKVIVVTRDPRDIYSELMYVGHAYPRAGVERFCHWYRSIMQHVNQSEWQDDRVIHIKFEDFVLNFPEEKRRLDDKLGLTEGVTSTYDPERSKKNIGKYKHLLKSEDIACLESELKNYFNYD